MPSSWDTHSKGVWVRERWVEEERFLPLLMLYQSNLFSNIKKSNGSLMNFLPTSHTSFRLHFNDKGKKWNNMSECGWGEKSCFWNYNFRYELMIKMRDCYHCDEQKTHRKKSTKRVREENENMAQRNFSSFVIKRIFFAPTRDVYVCVCLMFLKKHILFVYVTETRNFSRSCDNGMFLNSEKKERGIFLKKLLKSLNNLRSFKHFGEERRRYLIWLGLRAIFIMLSN